MIITYCNVCKDNTFTSVLSVSSNTISPILYTCLLCVYSLLFVVCLVIKAVQRLMSLMAVNRRLK